MRPPRPSPFDFLTTIRNWIEAVYELFRIDHWVGECYTIFLLYSSSRISYVSAIHALYMTRSLNCIDRLVYNDILSLGNNCIYEEMDV